MSLKPIKCPHCSYIYKTDIERTAKEGHAVVVRGSNGKVNLKPGKEMYIDLKCPRCNKEFEWQVK